MTTDSLALTPTTTPGSGDICFGNIKERIATYYGLDKDRAKLKWIGDVFLSVLDELNIKKLWNCNLITAADVTTSSNVDTYDFPDDMWRQYSIRKEDDVDFMTTSIRQYVFDRMFQGQLGITGFPYVNVTFNLFRDGTFQLFPIPDAPYTIKIRYFKLIAKPTADTDKLDMPRPYQVLPEYGTLARVAMLLEQSPKYWELKYQEVYQDMQRMDEDLGDEDLRFINTEETRESFLNPNARPRFLDLW